MSSGQHAKAMEAIGIDMGTTVRIYISIHTLIDTCAERMNSRVRTLRDEYRIASNTTLQE
jgi:hypothetical protein